MYQSYCNRCHAMIWWGTTRNGKTIPLEDDGWAVPNFNGAVMWDEFGHQFRGVPVSRDVSGAVKMFRPHFMYCPYADRFRKKKTVDPKIEEARKKAAEKDKLKAAKKAEKEAAMAAKADFERKQLSLF